MYISLWENSRGHPDNISFMHISTKIDGFEQKDSQGFEHSYNSYEQYPLEKFFIFTIYQNYTLALSRHGIYAFTAFFSFLTKTRKQSVYTMLEPWYRWYNRRCMLEKVIECQGVCPESGTLSWSGCKLEKNGPGAELIIDCEGKWVPYYRMKEKKQRCGSE